MPANSFSFAGINSLTAWGIKCIAHDVFSPPKRDRKQKIPFTSGSYDFGKKYHDEKIVTLECDTGHGGFPPLDKAGMREVIYELSKRDALILWDEPDKYYMGELFDSPPMNVSPKYVKQRFTLRFVCEPYAYGDDTAIPITGRFMRVSYAGTAETPTLIVLQNSSATTVSTVSITLIKRT
jgi:phage-related protein